MTPDYKKELTNFLLDSLNNILKYEEQSPDSRPDDITLREMHVIEAVANHVTDGEYARASEIASALEIVPGTLSIALKSLERKGYLTRIADENDHRSVRISLTELGFKAKQIHEQFHLSVVEDVLKRLNPQDAITLNETLKIVCDVLARRKDSLSKHKVKIFADSTCDLSLEDAKALDVTIIPMSIVFGEDVYRQNIDLTTQDFYTKLKESNVNPSTVQLTPYDLEQVYSDATSDHSEVVAIHLSSALSGTYQSAVIAAREVRGIYVVDSQNATIGSAILVRAAVKLRDKGFTAKEINERIIALSKKVRLVAYVDSLKYLVRGGRVSAAAGMIGGVLDIKPLIGVQNGAVVTLGKAKGQKAACRELIKLIKKDTIDNSYGIIFGSSDGGEATAELKKSLESFISDCSVNEQLVGPVIGTHAGPGAIAVAYIVK